MANKLNIGIDFGGVLSVHDGEGAEHKNTAVNVPGASEALKTLQEQGHNLYLLSFCGKKRAEETKAGLAAAGVSQHFVEQFYVRSTNYKADLCKHLGCHVMVDDRVDILDNVQEQAPEVLTILFGSSLTEHPKHLLAADWPAVLALLATVTPGTHQPRPNSKVNKLLYLL